MKWIYYLLAQWRQRLSFRIYWVVMLFVFLLSLYFTLNNYYTSLHAKQKDNLDELACVGRTTTVFIDGDSLEALMLRYAKKDEIKYAKSDPHYYAFHQLLKSVHKANNLRSDIYTLELDAAGHFEFGVTSSETPYYRHIYDSYPPDLPAKYWSGGGISPYEDDHGTWLSAVTPIRNSKGKVISVLMVDKRFEDFNAEARLILWKSIGVSAFALLVLAFSLYRTLQKILSREESAKRIIEETSELLRDKNQKLTDSIQYAKRIQEALMRDNARHLKHLSAYFHIYMPRDIVSGDFFWTYFCRNHDRLYIANVDCTGHGVPGALMSILGITSLNEIVVERDVSEPSNILKQLDQKVRNLLNQDVEKESNKARVQDGMDIGLCVIDFRKNLLEFAGAHMPMVVVSNGERKFIHGDKLSIGGHVDDAKEFTTHEIALKPQTRIYLYSDGFVDQFGEPEPGKVEKFKRRRLMDKLDSLNALDLRAQETELKRTFTDWMGKQRQIDDVSLIGLEVA